MCRTWKLGFQSIEQVPSATKLEIPVQAACAQVLIGDCHPKLTATAREPGTWWLLANQSSCGDGASEPIEDLPCGDTAVCPSYSHSVPRGQSTCTTSSLTYLLVSPFRRKHCHRGLGCMSVWSCGCAQWSAGPGSPCHAGPPTPSWLSWAPFKH